MKYPLLDTKAFIYPDYENLGCLGKNVDLEIYDNQSIILYKGYRSIVYFNNFILFLFFSSLHI